MKHFLLIVGGSLAVLLATGGHSYADPPATGIKPVKAISPSEAMVLVDALQKEIQQLREQINFQQRIDALKLERAMLYAKAHLAPLQQEVDQYREQVKLDAAMIQLENQKQELKAQLEIQKAELKAKASYTIVTEIRKDARGRERECDYLIRTAQGKAEWAEQAFQRGVKAEKYGNYLLAQTCYWNALAVYPDTPAAQRARAAYDRLNVAEAKEKLIDLAGKRFGKPDSETFNALADINDMDQLEFLTSRVPQTSSWQALLNPKSASSFRTTVSARARNLDRTWTAGQKPRD